MSAAPLFLTASPEFDKTAVDTRLGESSTAWPAEALAELYKQAPFVSEFDPNVVIQKADAERGYAFGHVLLSIPGTVTREAKVPLIIREGKLCAFDLLVLSTSQVTPLTQDRLRQAIFRPEMFDAAVAPPGTDALSEQLFPTGDTRQGEGRGTVRELGAKAASPLATLLGSANEEDIESFVAAAILPEVNVAMLKNAAATAEALRKIAAAEPARCGAPVEPDVVQFSRRGAGRYQMKWACRDPYAPAERALDRSELVRAVGEKVAAAVDIGGAVTLGASSGAASEPPGAGGVPSPVVKSGVYRVRDESGKELLGAAIVGLFDERGKKVPLTLFTSGAARALQTDVVGRYVGACAVPAAPKVEGKGFFFSDSAEGRVEATIPFTIAGKTTSPSGAAEYIAEAFGGGAVTLIVEPGIAEPLRAGEGKLLIPAHYQWSSLNDAAPRALESQEHASPKEAAAREIVVRGAGDRSFSIDGAPVGRLNASDRHFLGEDDARFLLSAMGVGDESRESLLSAADTGREPVRASVPSELCPPDAAADLPEKTAWPTTNVRELRRSLVKEAAVIPDRNAVDTVLSLGFLNDENLVDLARHLPEIEESIAKMCELLLATRIGLKDIPEAALERAIRASETVRMALRVMAFKTA